MDTIHQLFKAMITGDNVTLSDSGIAHVKNEAGWILLHPFKVTISSIDLTKSIDARISTESRYLKLPNMRAEDFITQ